MITAHVPKYNMCPVCLLVYDVEFLGINWSEVKRKENTQVVITLSLPLLFLSSFPLPLN